MKWLTVLFLVLLSQTATSQEAVLEFGQANELYRSGDYQKAASSYEKVISNGYESAEVYFNLGNAYFKLQNLPAAILNFERARRLSPRDEDILYNLRLANLRVVDKIEPVPQLFFIAWWKGFVDLASADRWAMLGIVLFWCTALAGCVFLIGRSVILQRISFFVALAALLLAVLAFISMSRRMRIEHDEQSAVVFAATVAVKSAPDAQSTDLFMLHEGVRVEFMDGVGDWRKIRLADGKVGWLLLESVRVI
jgi:tetratricopeptide (TPR) repeat protein